MSAGISVQEVIRQKEGKILQTIPFNSRRKRASTVIQMPNDTVRVFLKGAPEIVMEYCSAWIDDQGTTNELTEEKRKYIVNDIVTHTFAKRAFRTIMISYADITNKEYETLKAANNNFKTEQDREILENNLTIIGIYALQDPLRDEIIDSVHKCKLAGINVRMVTGDNIDTAKAIAIEAGIVSREEADNKYVCMEGKEFRDLCAGLKQLSDPNDPNLVKESVADMRNFNIIQQRLKVLARSTPEDKYMLVTGLKDMNAVVAVTGDGTNDAPALKKADVGFAMNSGTNVAKEASDIILIDDNFASIITAVKWGRNIYTNVRKFLQFQLTVNVVAMFIVFFGGVIVKEPPLTSVQMLWVNLIMDTCGALALATEPPSEDILDHPPYKRTERIVTSIMWRNILGQAIF
jgi:P-type Ca2+ transporter type 2B